MITSLLLLFCAPEVLRSSFASFSILPHAAIFECHHSTDCNMHYNMCHVNEHTYIWQPGTYRRGRGITTHQEQGSPVERHHQPSALQQGQMWEVEGFCIVVSFYSLRHFWWQRADLIYLATGPKIKPKGPTNPVIWQHHHKKKPTKFPKKRAFLEMLNNVQKREKCAGHFPPGSNGMTSFLNKKKQQ